MFIISLYVVKVNICLVKQAASKIPPAPPLLKGEKYQPLLY